LPNSKGKKSVWGGITEQHSIMDGLAQVRRVKMSGLKWQFWMYVKSEKQAYRKSLRTEDLNLAKKKATELAIDILSKEQAGKKIFGISLGELVEKYIEHRQRDVELGNITKDRLGTIRSQCNHLINLTKKSLKCSELDRDSFFDYFYQRRQQNPTVTKPTIRNEQATLNHMAQWAYRKGFLAFEKFDFDKIRMTPDDFRSRDTFTLDEYERLFTFMRSYVAKSRVDDDLERYERMIMRDYVLISANTLMRVGELRQMRWSDIKRIEEPTKDTAGREVVPVHLQVRGETSKVRTTRDIVTRGGQYFNRLEKTYRDAGVELKPSDLLFRQLNTNEKFGHRIWAKHWYAMMAGAGIDDHVERKVQWYSLRHFGISMRVNSGNNILDVAKMAGTSVSHVEKTYLKYDAKRMRRAILKGYITEDGGFEDA